MLPSLFQILFTLRVILVAGICKIFLPSCCLVFPNGETADSSLGCGGVKNNLQGLQAAMAWVRAAVTWQDLDRPSVFTASLGQGLFYS